MTGFFKGISNLSPFASLVNILYHACSVMHKAFENTEDKRVKALDKPELLHVSSLKLDMKFYHGDINSKNVPPTAATITCVNRVKEVALTEPYSLVAHHHTRYLGDLFGDI